LIADAYNNGVERSKERIAKLEGVIQELMEFVENYSDVIDDEDGQPEPNRAMCLLSMAQDVLEGKHD
jgi:C4-type Zn-finger protein